MIQYTLRQSLCNAGEFYEFHDLRLPYSGHRAKLLQQRTRAFGTDPLDLREARAYCRFAAAFSMMRNREAVGLVPDAREKLDHGGLLRQHNRIHSSGSEEAFRRMAAILRAGLGNTDRLQVFDSQVLEHGTRDVTLPFTSIDQHQLG